jgi:tRNA(Ile)-lysidine synthase TilS/MesJ
MASTKTPRKTSKQPIAVAFSGGLDSTVLLHAAIAAHGAKQVTALHIHHGFKNKPIYGNNIAKPLPNNGVATLILKTFNSSNRVTSRPKPDN